MRLGDKKLQKNHKSHRTFSILLSSKRYFHYCVRRTCVAKPQTNARDATQPICFSVVFSSLGITSWSRWLAYFVGFLDK